MADLFGLLQDLGERLASNGDSSCSTQPDEEDPVETRFRSVLPNLLRSYFLPHKVKEREFTAILKLLCHTIKNYPGVFYRGKAFAVLPVFGQLFPFFAQPAVSGRFGLLFETIGALVSLLKNGDRDAYRHICWGAILLLEDLVSMAPFVLSSTVSSRKLRVRLKCFCEAYGWLDCDANTLFCELPSCWRGEDGPGLHLDVTEDACWQPLAEWTMKLVEKIISEGMLHVEGLFTSSFIFAIGNMTCFGNSSLQKTCFELLSKLIPMVDIEMIPIERLVVTMTTIASVNECSAAFRNGAYDTALASCLSAIVTLLQRESIEMIAHHILQLIPESILYTESRELKIVLCGAYEMILKFSPPSIWGIRKIFRLISVSDICSHVSRCLDHVVCTLGLLKLDSEGIHVSSADLISDQNKIQSSEGLQESRGLGKKRRYDCSSDIKAKRRKYGQSDASVSADMLFEPHYSHDVHDQLEWSRRYCLHRSEIEEQRSSYLHVLHQQILGSMDAIRHIDSQLSGFNVDSRLSTFQVLACVFSCHPSSMYYGKLINLLELLIPWINAQAGNGSIAMAQILLFLIGVEKLLSSDVDKTFQRLGVSKELLELLQLLWTARLNTQREDTQKAKCCAVKIFCILESKHNVSEIKQLCMLAVNDEDGFIQSKMVLSLVNSTLFSGSELFEILRTMCMDKSSQVREAVAQSLGSIACKGRREASLTGAREADLTNNGRSCVQCPVCGLWESDHSGLMDNFHVDLWQPLCKYLLFEETSQKVQVAFITSMSSILTHSCQMNIFKMRQELHKCLDILPCHPHKAVRRAFCLHVKCFFYPNVLDGLFDDDGLDTENAGKELQILGKFKHALVHTEDPDLLESLLEAIAAVVLTASDRKQLFFFPFVLLLEQLDSKYASVQATCVSMLQKCLSVHSKDRKSGRLELMIDIIQSELFTYLSGRLITRPLIVQNYADAVLGLQMEDIIRQIVPIVLPKLVIQQQHTDDALKVLHSLSNHLGTELPLLLLEWCHKVLSVLLLKADGKDLMAALQFYESQTGSDTREIFTAVLPALLDELVQFLGDTSNEVTVKRSARVPLMIQEVACIVSGSDELPGFLKTHFVGLLNSVDRKMLKSGDIRIQKQGLRCIDQLIEMIGIYLSAFIPKIMVLLTRAVQEPKLQVECLEVWLSFARRLASVCPANLKSVASQIVVAVMPCLEQQKESSQTVLNSVVKLLEELLITNISLLDDQAGELPLLPSLPELTNVNFVLQQARGVNTLCGQLRRASEGIRHENISVRLMASSELKKLIISRRNDVVSMMLGESSTDATIISDLVLSLLQGCVEESRSLTSEKFKLLCAECLGELGAVDPVKLNLKLQVRSKIERSDDDLIFELIDKHLVRVLRAAAETDIQDSAALAIQELLKLSGCREAIIGSSQDQSISKQSSTPIPEKISNRKNKHGSSLVERGEKLWSRFSEDVKDIITPCLTSKYLLKNANAPSLSGTIFSSGLSFRRWMYLWVRRLVLLSTGSRSLIFNACKGILRHDMSTVLYLLPYIVLNVVCDGTVEARACVTEEILGVLAEAASTGNGTTCVKNHGEMAPSNECRSLLGPSEVSIQAVFTLLDNLAQWLDETKKDIMVQTETLGTQKGQHGNTKSGKNMHITHSQVMSQHCHVSQLLEAVPKTALAGASFRCQAYARALLYFESHVRAKSGALNPAAERSGSFEDDDISFLLGVYSGLDEPDGLSGLSRLHKSLSLQDEVLINEKAGNWAEALTCCEQALQMDPKSISRHEGALNCLLNMGHLQAMVTHVDGLLHRFPENKKEWSMWGVQAAWRLGHWGLLGEYVNGATGEGNQIHSTNAFDISLAKVLLAMQRKDNHAFSKSMIQARHELLAPLAAASMESYSRAYPFIIKLHMLHELESFQELFVDEGLSGEHLRNNLQKMVNSWEARIKVTQPSLWAREPILVLHRLILTRSDLHLESGNCWLQYAKLCRVAGHYETARRAILEAQSAGAPDAHIELAKLLWDTKRSHRAIAELQQALAKTSVHVLGAARTAALGGLLHIPSAASIVVQESHGNGNVDVAKTLLLLARWVHSTGQKQKEDVLSMYTRVKELQPKWEKSYFYLARYCDDILADTKKRQEERQEQYPGRTMKQQSLSMATIKVDEEPWWSLLPEVILYYAKGLHQGHRHLFQALPRLLTLWFEFGSNYHGETLSSTAAVKSVHARVSSIMWSCTNDLPSYQWLTTLPQLVSRICHQNAEVLRLVKHIITSVLQAYPQQALWTMAAVSKSTVSARRSAAAEILKVARNGLHKQSVKVLFNQFAPLIDQLIRLCFHQASPKARTLSLSSEFSLLKRMMPVGIIMPVQRALTVTLPANGLTNAAYNPFASGDFSTISGIGEEVEILASLQRPKKVILHGSDGKEYPFLCKPKDDLRKDARMMEFTTMINRLLSKDPRSRRRKLYIRTFAVIPLTEDCGMVEWVLHTRGLRHILQDIYISLGVFDRTKTNLVIKKIYEDNKEKVSEVEMFQTQILPMFPPVFHKWFLNTFFEPANWFQSRIAYAHTTAVWSMVGHIVGLGDRHGENILFDSTTGDCVHVDFSCLFDRGLQLEKPELVPFRLTQNMVDGLGITGYEGVFSRVCEITLSVLRANRETLTTVLETFIHDPLVEWTKSHKSSGVEVKNPHAQRAIANIKERLQGVVVGVGAAPSLPLSVEGQANQLIVEAVSHENLARMYIWWMPWF